MDSHGINDSSRSPKYMDIYCVEYDQENCVISDLDTMDLSTDGGKHCLIRTQKKISSPTPSLFD